MATQVSTADSVRRQDVLRFLAATPDAKLGEVARACRMVRGEASQTLDRLIAEGLLRVRHPWLVRLFGPLMALFVGAERYSLTKEGVWQFAQEPDGESPA